MITAAEIALLPLPDQRKEISRILPSQDLEVFQSVVNQGLLMNYIAVDGSINRQAIKSILSSGWAAVIQVITAFIAGYVSVEEQPARKGVALG